MKNIMKYDLGHGTEKNWLVAETQFSTNFAKCESIMNCGNGFIGVRSSHEEYYSGERRALIVSGTFNKACDGEVSELPVAAELTNFNFTVNGEKFSLLDGTIKNYIRTLNLKNGLVRREIDWVSVNGIELKLEFKRFVSLDDRHLIGQYITIKPISNDIELIVETGIEGDVYNVAGNKRKHFEDEVYSIDGEVITLSHNTNDSKVGFAYSKQVRVDFENVVRNFTSDNMMEIKCNVKKGEEVKFDIVSNVITTRDKDIVENNITNIVEFSKSHINTIKDINFESLFGKSELKWASIWNEFNIKIDSTSNFDQLAIRFAQYHLVLMTPAGDSRLNIGAKGFTGEGYKGHTFWDTEIFILPFWIFTKPEVARSLVKYRYLGLEGARKKAAQNGYDGAQYPWEAAWPADGETCPEWGAPSIHDPSKRQKIWTGFIELHITSDVIIGLLQYVTATGDFKFLREYGYEMIFDTAIFWQSRLEYNEAEDNYQITDVIGPDEYKEHVNNNAFTNFTARKNIEYAIEFYYDLKDNDKEKFNELNNKLNLDKYIVMFEEKINKVKVQEVREDLLLPQDDTYLELKEIALDKYKQQEKAGLIGQDYDMHELSNFQVSKQADVMVLFYLFEDAYTKVVKKKNFEYYESRTLHDSSLSLSTHSILAADIGDSVKAYQLFNKATEIDLGPVMGTSDEGVHTASLGGIWQCVVFGFGGARLYAKELRIEPKLPAIWNELEYPIMFKGSKLIVNVNRETFKVTKLSGDDVEFFAYGKKYKVSSDVVVIIND